MLFVITLMNKGRYLDSVAFISFLFSYVSACILFPYTEDDLSDYNVDRRIIYKSEFFLDLWNVAYNLD